MSLNISIIDHYSQIPGEPGNNRFLYLANLLVDKGHNVEIITTTFAHKTKKQRSINDSKINTLSYKFIFLPEPGYSKNISVFRLWSHFIFGINLYKQLNLVKDKIDILYVASSFY